MKAKFTDNDRILNETDLQLRNSERNSECLRKEAAAAKLELEKLCIKMFPDKVADDIMCHCHLCEETFSNYKELKLHVRHHHCLSKAVQ